MEWHGAVQLLEFNGNFQKERMVAVSLINEMLEAKALSNRSQPYLTSLRQMLVQFSKGRERSKIDEITTATIESWLAKYQNPYTRQTWLNRFNTLFSFAKRRGYVKVNPCDAIERIKIDRAIPKIFTPEQAEYLLVMAPAKMRAYLVLGMYCGLRPEEISAPKPKGKPAKRLQWESVNLETKTIAAFGKRRPRLVPLEPKAVQLLAVLRKPTGPIAPSLSVIKRERKKLRALFGWSQWPKDILRKSAASYLTALKKDTGIVKTILGNSEGILWRHYLTPVTDADCQKFWRVEQPTPTSQLTLPF